jgi:cyclase
MLKRRIIPIQLLLSDRLVKTVGFGDWRDVGDPVKSAAVYNSQQADELIFLNVDRDRSSVEPLLATLKKVSEVCFMPLAVGGGIRTFEDASRLIESGADKIVINSAAYTSSEVLRKVADRFGEQAVVVGVDVRRSTDGDYILVADSGRLPQPIKLEAHIKACEAAGAGEFLVQSVDRDGQMTGFDLDLLHRAAAAATVPVIGCGGSGQYDHLKEAFLETDVSALACGSLFNFSDSNPMRAKAYLTNYGLSFKVV